MSQQADAKSPGSPDWQAFMTNPAGYTDAVRLVACFDGAISEATCERMLRSQRLHQRLSALLFDHYGLASAISREPVEKVDRAIVLLSSEELEELVLRSGAIYWAGRIAAVIDGREAAALQAALGADLCAFAVASRDLAGPMQSFEAAEDIHERVYADGLCCLSAWCQTMPDETAMRVRLKLMPHDIIDGAAVSPFDEVGPAIVRRAMDYTQ
jgi:hypothetical protein